MLFASSFGIWIIIRRDSHEIFNSISCFLSHVGDISIFWKTKLSTTKFGSEKVSVWFFYIYKEGRVLSHFSFEAKKVSFLWTKFLLNHISIANFFRSGEILKSKFVLPEKPTKRCFPKRFNVGEKLGFSQVSI